MRPQRRAILTVAVVLVGLSAVAAVVTLTYADHYRWLSHETCTSRPIGSTQQFWTPVILLDSPYGGSASATAALISPAPSALDSATITARNGTADALLSLDNWTLSQSSNTTAAGAGIDQPCGGAYGASDLSREGGRHAGLDQKAANLLASNATSDQGVPSRLSASVIWSDNFSEATQPALTICGPGSATLTLAPASELRFEVPFAEGPMTIVVTAAVPALVTYTYSFDAGAQGVWSLDGSAQSDGFGLAFDWTPCQ
ncbi:MAG: hypothetical protein L3K00_00535 [Thermoplasmata archaeon]|nr:hypothetical protein [Thermoplasmata archaeon]